MAETINMTGFKKTNPFQSLINYGQPEIPSGIPVDGFNPYTGQTNWLKGTQASELAGLDMGAVSGAGDMWGGGGFFDSLKNWGKNSGFLGSTENGVTTQGWGGTALGITQGLGNAWMGMKQYGLAKDQLAQSKKQFEMNYAAQQKTTNLALEDRQRARVASNPGAYQSVGDYMKKNGI